MYPMLPVSAILCFGNGEMSERTPAHDRRKSGVSAGLQAR